MLTRRSAQFKLFAGYTEDAMVGLSLGPRAYLLTPLLILVAASFAEAQPKREYSFSLADAKRRGAFVTEVEMVPSVLKWKGETISIKDAWVEKSKSGGCYICFHLKEGRDAFGATGGGAMLVLGDEDAGVTMHFGRGWTQVVQYIESPDFSRARFSLMGGWKDERPKNIRFVTKKK
jgi:hypothetical protein